ncbi:flippase [Microcoleus sp. FACHB-68]|uniref:flippase n=1 Tax=Microcoleus sp. FACHB-68 TaxID=2692826 RepID=UPI001682727C|nr:flippase [Microcoleus sp. FACHB-68]MBD1939976.1 flippase [Microcoleus sp. FACHB-68]
MLNKLTAFTKKLSPGLRKVIANTAWLFAEKFLQMGLGLLVGVWVARYLGPDEFGLLNYAIAFVGLFSPIATLGLGQIVVRDLARDPSCKEETLGTAFVLKFLGGLLTLFLTVGTLGFLNPTDNRTFGLVAAAATGTVFLCFEVIDFWFQSQVQSKFTVWSTNSAYVIINAVKITLIQLRSPLIAFSWALTGEKILSAIALGITYQWRGHLLKAWRFSFRRAKELLKDSWPLILSGFVIMIYMRIDQVMLGQMRNSSEVGVYSAAVKISEMWYFIPGAIIQSVFPSIVKAKEISEEVYYGRVQKLLNLMAVVSYAVAIPMTFLSGYIIDFLYGKQYVEASPPLAVLVWAGLFVSLGLARGPWLITEGLIRFSASTTAVGAVVNVFLNFLLIPTYGGLGAGIATVIAQGFAAYGANAFYPKTRVIFLKQTKALFLIDFIKNPKDLFNIKSKF